VSRRYNLRRLKTDCSYTASELGELLRVNIGTVRRWVADGLQAIDERRPQLFRGDHVASFLQARAKARVPLQVGEFYCFRCKAPRSPQNRAVWLLPRSFTTADLMGRCSICATVMFRRVRRSEAAAKLGACILAFGDDQITIKRAGNVPQMPSCGRNAG
jgi:hypothetical protein